MIDTEINVNPIYGDILKIVNEAMIKFRITRVSQCPDVMSACRLRKALYLKEFLPDYYPFKPTWHELSAFLCGDLVINAQHQQLLKYVSNLSHNVDPVQIDALDIFTRCASRFPRTIRWALLLHDIAKDRYPRYPAQNDPNPNNLDHPSLCEAVVKAIFRNLIELSKALGEYRMDEASFDVVLWLVKNHDILGNMFTGERAPDFLLKETRKLDKCLAKQYLSLLQVVTLCDLWATAGGKYLTEKKARYWLSFSDPGKVEARQRELFDWRMQRWAGDLNGEDNQKKTHYVTDQLDKSCLNAREVFGPRINYVVYGFYLFTALSEEELSNLLILLLKEYKNKILGEAPITLAFQKYKPWEPETEKVLLAYREQIKGGKLNCKYDESTKTLNVVAL